MARHTFPGPFTFKVIGRTDGNFTARVVAEVRNELQLEIDTPYRFSSARNGAHVSVTLDPECDSPQQVLAIYSRLMGLDGVIMLL